MFKRLTGIYLALFAFSAFCQSQQAPEPPLEDHTFGLIVFAIMFVGFCLWIVLLVWKGEKNKAVTEAEAGTQEKHA